MENFGGVITPEGGDTKMSAPGVTHPRHATDHSEACGRRLYLVRVIFYKISKFFSFGCGN